MISSRSGLIGTFSVLPVQSSFQEYKNTNPVIYLRGIQYSEMESILQFIYLGEAKFYEERMNEFFNVAKNLDIRELAKGIEDGDETLLFFY